MDDMKQHCRGFIFGLVIVMIASAAWTDDGASDAGYQRWIHEKEIMVPMRDGVRLSTDLVMPAEGEGPWPTVLVRTPYSFEKLVAPEDIRYVTWFVDQDYAVVLQNERGRHFSEGTYTFLAGARTDGPDTIEWIAEQP